MKPIELFQLSSHWKVLHYMVLVGNSEMLSVGEISKRIGLSKPMVSRALQDLESAELMVKKTIAHSHIYEMKDSVIGREIKKIVGLSLVKSSRILEVILREDEDIISVLLYGSFSAGDFDNNSDIDILIITNSRLRKDKLISSVQNFSVNYSTFTPGTWLKLKEVSDPFHVQVVKNHIVLHGSEVGWTSKSALEEDY